MGFNQFQVAILVNGVRMEKDDNGNALVFPEGSNVYDTLEMLSQPDNLNFGLSGYSHVSINGITKTVDSLKDMKLTADIEVQLINKSEGGIK